MNPPIPQVLLVRDRYYLDRVAKHLKNDRRVFFGMVCSPELVGLTVEYLRVQSGKDVPVPKRVTDPDEMLEILWNINTAPSSEVVAVNIAGTDVPVWTAFNFHREKLLRGARLLLFLDTIDDLLAFQCHAPDAYSFRETVFMVEGAPEGTPETMEEADEPFDIRTARLLYELKKKPLDKAEAAIMLVRALHERGRKEDVIRTAREALAFIPTNQFTSGDSRRIRVTLYDFLSTNYQHQGQVIASFQVCQRGLDDVKYVSGMDSLRLNLELDLHSGPLGVDRHVRQWDLKDLPEDNIKRNVCQSLGWGALSRGRIKDALQFQEEVYQSSKASWIRAGARADSARIFTQQGRFRLAKKNIREADELFFRAKHNTTSTRLTELGLLIAEGELYAAETIATSQEGGSAILADIAAYRGDMSRALTEYANALTVHIAKARDKDIFDTCKVVARVVKVAYAAHALSPAHLENAWQLVESAGQWLMKTANHNPVWYDVLVPSLQAQVLILFDDRQKQALEAAELAVSLARSQWTQALARSLRIQVQCFAHVGLWKEMKQVIIDGMQAARAEDDLIEWAMLQAYDLARLVRKNANQEQIDTAKRVLCETFAEMSAPRVEGDICLEIAPYLPLDTKSLNLLEIGDHVYDLFTEMPMPACASRTMEWLGDIYATRGNLHEAKNAYLMALKPLIAHGFELRRPVVQNKLDGLQIKIDALC